MTTSKHPQHNEQAPQAQQQGEPLPYDEMISPLLDQTLKAPAMPVDLAQRIFASTRGHLVAANAHWTRRLGPIWLRRANAVAAGIVLASSVALMLVASGILRDAHHTVEAKQDIAELGQYQWPQTQLDQEILQLAMSVEAASSYTYVDTDAARTVSALENMLTPAGSSPAPSNTDYYNSLF